MEEVVQATEQALLLTSKAVAHLKGLLAKDNCHELALRVFVSPLGSNCSYGVALDDAIQDDDHVYEQEGVRIVVDEASTAHLTGVQVDYLDRQRDGGFTILNRNGGK